MERKEEWRPVTGYEGLYKVSNCGEVFSVRKNILLTRKYNRLGYQIIILYKEGKGRLFYVHRLVAQAFIQNTYNYPCINHKDENKMNNKVDNLEWCTYKYNSNYGSCAKKIGFKNMNKESTSTPVLCFIGDKLMKEYPSMNEAERQTGIFSQNILKCCQGKTAFAGGYRWVYKYGRKRL